MGKLNIQVDAGPFVRMLVNQLGPRAIRASVMAGIRDATRFLQRILRPLMPTRTGESRRRIIARKVRQDGPIFSGGVKRPIILNILEPGAKPHEIVPKQRKALVFGEQGVTLQFASRVRHPGFPGRPFWEQTAKGGEAEALRIFGQRIEEMIRKAQGTR